jgi:hypothetical protein
MISEPSEVDEGEWGALRALEIDGSTVAGGERVNTGAASPVAAFSVSASGATNVTALMPGHDTPLNVVSWPSTSSLDAAISVLASREMRCEACNPIALRFRKETSSEDFTGAPCVKKN